MYINTVESLKDSFTDFKRVVHAYVWAQVKEYDYTETDETYRFVFCQLEVVGEDEANIKDKADKFLRSAYPAEAYIITNIIPYKEVLTRELRKEISDVLREIHSAQQS